jgi:hypothetical protein
MASTRSNRTLSSAAQPAVTPSEAVTTIVRESARIQLAAFSAVGKGLADWAGATERLTHALGDELLRRLDGESDSRELIVAAATATTAHLYDLAALACAVATHFDVRLSRTSNDA